MRRTITRQMKRFLIILMCGAFLLVNGSVAFAATEAVYEDDVERWENNVYRGIVNTDELNVRSAAGKNNPVVQVNGKGVTLDKQDEVAILDEALSSGEKWYKVSFRRDETLVVGYVHSYYVELTTDVITPLPTLYPDPLSASADSTIDSQSEESGSSIVFWIAIVVVAILILCIKDKISDHSYSKGYSGTSYSSSSSSSDNGGSSSSSYGYSEPFHAINYVRKHCSAYRLGMELPKDQEIIKNDQSLTSEQKKEALRELESLSHLWDWD